MDGSLRKDAARAKVGLQLVHNLEFYFHRGDLATPRRSLERAVGFAELVGTWSLMLLSSLRSFTASSKSDVVDYVQQISLQIHRRNLTSHFKAEASFA